MQPKKTLQAILKSTQNVRFQDFVRLVVAFGFSLDRVQGSHHIFKHPELPELINLQDYRGQALSD